MEIVTKIEDLFLPSQHHKFFKDDSNSFERLTWEEVIDNIDRNVCDPEFPIKIRNNLGIVTHDTRDIIKTYPLRQLITDIQPHIHPTCHLYASFTSISETFGKHNDLMDVIIWQCLGITQWTIYDEKIYQYNLKQESFFIFPWECFMIQLLLLLGLQFLLD